MRIVVPYTRLHERAIRPLMDLRLGAQAFAYVGQDDEAYWRLLCELWADAEDFLIVEHDMELHAEVIPQLVACENDWCVFPYSGSQPIWTRKRTDNPPRTPVVFRCALGCTRFRRQLMLDEPQAITHMRLHTWRRLDSQLASYLFQHGYKACEHEPHVIHHHDYAADNKLHRRTP